MQVTKNFFGTFPEHFSPLMISGAIHAAVPPNVITVLLCVSNIREIPKSQILRTSRSFTRILLINIYMRKCKENREHDIFFSNSFLQTNCLLFTKSFAYIWAQNKKAQKSCCFFNLKRKWSRKSIFYNFSFWTSVF